MSQELVITAVGVDRPGIAAELSGHVHAARGNLADSRMVNLRGKFALVALVEGEAEVLAAVKERLRQAAGAMKLTIEFSAADSRGERTREGVPFRLKTYSMDQPGIVHRMTQRLFELGINIEELETNLESAPFMGSPLFTVEMHITVPPNVPLRSLRQELEQACTEMNCDVDLEPV